MQNTMEMVSMAVVTMGLTPIASETVETLEPLVTVAKNSLYDKDQPWKQ